MLQLSPGALRFLRYAGVGVSTLALDLVLLFVLKEFVGIPYYVAIPLAFLLATSLNYAISRVHVFRGTLRPVHHGYLYFILLASLGATITTSATAFLVEFFALHYLLARVGVAGFVGLMNYLLNLHFNFRVVGHHP